MYAKSGEVPRGLWETLSAMSCSQLYLGLDEEIENIDGTVFSVIRSTNKNDKNLRALRAVTNSKYIYYLLPHTGCGCGWDVPMLETDHKSESSAEELHLFLQKLLEKNSNILILSTCFENEGHLPEEENEIQLNQFIDNLSTLRVEYGSKNAKIFHIRT